MAESQANSESRNGAAQGNEEQDDYMGDLSQFLPSEALNPPKSSSKKITNKKDTSVNSSKSQLKTLSWQERRKLERERKQQQEDEETLAKVEAPIPQSNIGFKLLKQMGYTPGSALGKQGLGRAEPVGIEIRRSRAGIGLENPHKEKRKKEEIMIDRKKRKEQALMEEFGSRQKSRWQSRRVVDLQDVLMKLRDEFNYCLFCGCKVRMPFWPTALEPMKMTTKLKVPDLDRGHYRICSFCEASVLLAVNAYCNEGGQAHIWWMIEPQVVPTGAQQYPFGASSLCQCKGIVSAWSGFSLQFSLELSLSPSRGTKCPVSIWEDM
ncbi:G-patch domain [Sesbania bispinosa]|nr:G-patch domain [Sesbania bispinosa]